MRDHGVGKAMPRMHLLQPQGLAQLVVARAPVTDIRTAPNGNLSVVSLQKGTIYEISRANAAGNRRGR